MKEFIEKLIGRLEEEKEISEKEMEECIFKALPYHDSTEGKVIGIKNAIEIVNKLADEYNNGWIPCSERLPENISTVLVQVEEFESPTIGWYGNIAGWRLSEKDFDELNDFTVIAWQSLPPAYQPKGE